MGKALENFDLLNSTPSSDLEKLSFKKASMNVQLK